MLCVRCYLCYSLSYPDGLRNTPRPRVAPGGHPVAQSAAEPTASQGAEYVASRRAPMPRARKGKAARTESKAHGARPPGPTPHPARRPLQRVSPDSRVPDFSLFDSSIEWIAQRFRNMKRLGIWMKRIEEEVRCFRNDGTGNPEKDSLILSEPLRSDITGYVRLSLPVRRKIVSVKGSYHQVRSRDSQQRELGRNIVGCRMHADLQ